jgi:hypothetical protein
MLQRAKKTYTKISEKLYNHFKTPKQAEKHSAEKEVP